ncbi:hypothetical protein PMZ80_002838 [Knufia obscura]|uniref:Yeast cell wall synthesis Kre9/Knh1-like N-terminal domain-containing protein n=1 Tax=Knufia obscura TaxID=1635080 RepID=A0ABR0RZI6_9EURO|nr:hypothetical protein PMZ80_002838 [Knufia obscura]
MMKSVISAAGFVAAASAFTQPTSQTFGALLTPDLSSPVTTGQTYSVTWAPSSVAGQTVSLVLCNGPGSNCQLQGAAIVEGVSAAAGSYSWSVPCSLSEGTQNTDSGYGMLIIVDGTGEFQYSTQFSVTKGSSCGAETTTTSASTSTPSTTLTTSASTSSSAVTTFASTSYPDGGKSWYGWATTMNTTTTTPLGTATSSSKYSYTKAPEVQTSTTKAAEASSSVYASHVSSSAAAVATSATPKPYTGAAALPTAFANVVGVVGFAGLAMFAL